MIRHLRDLLAFWGLVLAVVGGIAWSALAHRAPDPDEPGACRIEGCSYHRSGAIPKMGP